MSAGQWANEPGTERMERDPVAQPQSPSEPETQRLRAENAALLGQLALRDDALDATPTFFVITKLAKPESIIVYCNKSVADQLGCLRQELVGKRVGILTQWVGRNSNYASDARAALRAGRTFNYEDEVTRRDGSQFWLGVSIRPLYDDSGSLTHTVTVGADITAKREELQKKQELQNKLV